MKTITAALLLGTALVVAATVGFAAQYSVYVTGYIKQYTHRNADTTVIVPRAFNNRSLIISSSTTNTTATLIYQDNGTGTNLFLIVDSCGNVIATNALLYTGHATCGGQAVNGYLYEQICLVPIQLLGSGYGTTNTGGYAYVVTDTKIQPIAHSTTTNFSLRASGVVANGDGDSGTITFSATTLFKPAAGCPH